MADEWLIFVDTNIYLDFYRYPGEKAKRQLEALERHKDRLIISDQIEMEFLKNRQKVILKALGEIKRPVKSQYPQVVVGSEPVRLLQKSEKETEKRFNQLKKRFINLLERPGNYDEVYTSFRRLHSANSRYNLKRPDKKRYEIRRLARKRFALGYPPRKPGDTSIGDAVHWEWIIDCALSSAPNQHILLVARDGDFGANIDGKSFLNDWLRREFKNRVSSKRKIELTQKLTDALRVLDEMVTDDDVEVEDKVIEDLPLTNYMWLYLENGLRQRAEEKEKFDEALRSILDDLDSSSQNNPD